MFADLFDLNPMQLAGVVGSIIVATIFLIRSRRNARRHQEQWSELRQGLRSTSNAATSKNSYSKRSQQSDSADDSETYNWRKDDSTVYIPEHSVELEGVAAKIQEIERTATARIDTKIVLMQQLLIQTESAINKLQHALESAEQVGLLDHNPMPRRSVDEQLSTSKTGSDSRNIRTDLNAAEHTGHVISGRVSLPPKLDEDPRFVRVYALADGGLSATKIATQTGMQIGEVELILSLRPRQKVHA